MPLANSNISHCRCKIDCFNVMLCDFFANKFTVYVMLILNKITKTLQESAIEIDIPSRYLKSLSLRS